jgi:hypothetical protein
MSPFDFEFMRNAYAAAALTAVTAGAAGYFLVLRGQSFAGHALGHVGFAGAAGALLLGASPLAGLMAVATGGGMLMASALCSPARSPSACCSWASSPPAPPRPPRCCSATCSAWTARPSPSWR